MFLQRDVILEEKGLTHVIWYILILKIILGFDEDK